MTDAFRHRHLLGIGELSAADISHVLDTAKAFFEISRRPVRKVPTLRGKTVINVFFEASTRTRTSFELAGKRLSADVVNISASASSVSKGESLQDTFKTLRAMQPDAIVLRHPAAGAAQYVSRCVDCAIINGGDGFHEHPTQALLDAFTVWQARGTLENLQVLICGDIAHSRVARSHMLLWQKMGSRVRVVGPPTLVPPEVEQYGVQVYDHLEPALEGVDVIVTLRIQQERILGALLPSLREYSRYYGIGERHLRLANPDALILHPGPINRGIEIDPTVADGAASKILDQVEAGVAVRMAVLYLLIGEAQREE